MKKVTLARFHTGLIHGTSSLEAAKHKVQMELIPGNGVLIREKGKQPRLVPFSNITEIWLVDEEPEQKAALPKK